MFRFKKFIILFFLTAFFSITEIFPQIILKGKVYDGETEKNIPCIYTLIETESGVLISEKKSADGSFEVTLKPDLQYNLIFKADFYEELGITFRINKNVQRNFAMETLKEGSISSLGDLPFEQGKADITPETEEKLAALSQFLHLHPKIKKLEIRGHTDKVGDPLMNMKLSQMRAQAVVNYLILKGIDAERLLATGYGSTMPVEKNANPKNRRVEIKILAADNH